MNLRTLTFASLTLVAGCDEPPKITFSDATFGTDAVDVPPTPPGQACGVNEQGEPLGGCSRGQYCVAPEEGFPNGYCAPDCRAAPCPTGAVCYPSSASRHYCLRGCERDSDCRTREGYVCRVWNPGSYPSCLPNDEPVGRRNGGPCYASEGDAGVGPFLAPLPAVTFTEPSVSVSREGFGTLSEAETSLAIAPTSGTAVLAFMGVDGHERWRGGFARINADGTVGAPATLHDFDFPDVLQPSVAFDRSGRLHVVYVANNPDIPGNALRHAASADQGATFERARSVLTSVACGLACAAPAVAVGPDGAGEAVYAGTIAGQRDGSGALIVARMAVDGTAFDPSTTLSAREIVGQQRRAPGIAALTAGPASGEVVAAWVMRNLDNALAGLGDPVNRVRVRSSSDGGRTWGTEEDITRAGDAPVAHVPWVARAHGVTHVVYVTGGLLGAWDVVLATKRDGESTWRHRVVNDDPDRCATHGFTGLAIDSATGDAHVAWIDGRFAAAVVAYARCPADSTQRCARNEAVSSTGFVLSTAADPMRWHGTRSALALGADGTLFAAWSDTRTGGPGVYLARGHALTGAH